jgi:hypothetical protein
MPFRIIFEEFARLVSKSKPIFRFCMSRPRKLWMVGKNLVRIWKHRETMLQSNEFAIISLYLIHSSVTSCPKILASGHNVHLYPEDVLEYFLSFPCASSKGKLEINNFIKYVWNASNTPLYHWARALPKFELILMMQWPAITAKSHLIKIVHSSSGFQGTR